MREEDKVVNYRPELVKKLQSIMDDTLRLYSQNQVGMLYLMLEKQFKDEGDLKTAELLSKASQCCLKQDLFYYEEFVREYRDDLNKLEYGLGDITEPSAARVVFEIYSKMVMKDKENLDLESLTKAEKYMVDHFFNVLLAPTRNPNIQIKEGHSKCYYDESRDGSFATSMKFSIEYIQKECGNTLDIFNTPDEELDKESDIEM